jgi:hypothetical protein
MQIINYPKTDYCREDYFNLYDKVVDMLRKNDDVKCICTFGGVNQPGISDIDLLITFKNGATYHDSIIENLSDKEKALFTHGIMALSEEHWFKNKAYALWDNQKIIFGDAPSGNTIELSEEELRIIKKETALEFLFTNYIDLTLQKEYGIIKLRDTLQHTKGLVYDLDYLNIENSPIDNYISKAKEWISNWHKSKPADKEITIWFNQFYEAYSLFLTELFKENRIYLSESLTRKFAKNITLIDANSISYSRKGIKVSSLLYPILQKRTLKISNKLNSFEFYIPSTNQPENIILDKRIAFFSEMKKYNQLHFPKLGLLTTSLMSKLV